jgi:NitT/TauT family transport system ATP-binding protein
VSASEIPITGAGGRHGPAAADRGRASPGRPAAPAPAVKLAARGVGYAYAGPRPVRALEGIDLEVRDNEFVVLVGPSGCGKTTLLHLVAGFLRPTEGAIECAGRPVAGPGPDRGYVFQEDAVFPWMTVRQNVEFGLLARGAPAAERTRVVRHFVDLVGLQGFEEALPRELSGGMLKRVDIARAYAIDPAVLLMDEPFGPLDAQTRAAMQDALGRIWEQARKTVLFVTHDIDEAIYLADRVVVFTPRPGRVAAVIDVDLPRPRRPDVRLGEAFLALRRRAWQALGLA